nr:reverse transcriptase domain-containing protein [Tanacetum cinerariifolium]
MNLGKKEMGGDEGVGLDECANNLPPVPSDDVSDEPLIIEAEVEARLTQTHRELVGFSREQLLSMGKIKLEVMFRSEGLTRRMMMKFKVVQASSPYNIILGRTGVKELHAISSTTHARMKFPTLRGIATLVPHRDTIFECRQLEGNQILSEEQPKEEAEEAKRVPQKTL